MTGRLARGLLLGAVLSLSSFARSADEPADKLPPPRPVPGQPVEVLPEFPAYPRSNRYDIWQYYGVDRSGRFRPRVIYSPYGAYYLYNGAPYPWVTTNPRDIMPYVVD